jgi:amidase
VIPPPSAHDVQEIAATYGIVLNGAETDAIREACDVLLGSYRQLGSLPASRPEVKYARTPGRRAEAQENPFGAWQWLCSIHGSGAGPLAGHRVALKDTICVAGVPMANGSAILDGYVPDFDATVVSRILDAGGEIAGKAATEDHSFSVISNSSFSGPVLNPRDIRFSAGGSSSGCAALVASGAVDLALGGDQGGSIVIPSALCGVAGLKPTFGLVPYTGIVSSERTVDHVGPIASSVDGLARLLEAVAGADPLDPRQSSDQPRPQAYVSALAAPIDGLRIGVLEEGFGWPGSEHDVDESVREAIASFTDLGAKVKTISIPIHRRTSQIYDAYYIDGLTAQVWQGNGVGSGWQGFYPDGLIDWYARARKAHANDFSDLVKMVLIFGHYTNHEYNGRFYAKAQNVVRTMVRPAYAAAFDEVDVIAMPTTPRRPVEFSTITSRLEYMNASWGFHLNSCPFALIGNPNLSVPCARLADGLPVGLLLAGRPFEEATLLRAAAAIESLGRYPAR